MNKQGWRPILGVRPRLLLFVGLPLLLLLLLTGQRASRALDESRAASSVERSLERADALLKLNAELFDERMAVQAFFTRNAEPGAVERFAPEVLGRYRSATDTELEAVANANYTAEVARKREVQDRGRNVDFFPGRYGGVIDDVRDDIDREFDLVREASVLLDAPELQESMAIVEASFAGSAAAFETVVQIQSYWGAAEFERSQLKTALARADQRFDEQFRELERVFAGRESLAAPIDSAWATTGLLTNPVDSILADVEIGLAPSAIGPLPDSVTGATLPGAMVDLSVAASDQAHEQAGSLAANARRNAIIQFALAGLFLVLATVGLVMLTRSIVRPARRLADSAGAIAGGRLEGSRLDPRGASEFRVAADAFNELVENLELAQRKITSLGAAEFDAEVMSQPLPGRMGEGLDQSFEQLSTALREQDRLREQLEYDASHDPLTGVLNREAILQADRSTSAESQSDSDSSTLIAVIELRSFKSVNDTYGDAVGDDVLRQVARRLAAIVGSVDSVARIGGDEFAVVMNVAEPASAVRRGKDLLRAVTASYEVGRLTITIGADVGLAAGSHDRRSLLGEAVLAAQEARIDADASVRVFDDAMRSELDRRSEIEGWLIDALKNDTLVPGRSQLWLEYQPVVDTSTRSVPLCEALVRCSNPDGKLVPTGELVEVAERSALILQLGAWVLETATTQLAAWAAYPQLGSLGMSINASAIQLLDPDFADQVDAALVRTGAPTDRITIEVTETALIHNTTLAAETLTRLRRLGIKIAIDDFGSGFTGIAQLRSLPADKLKIDRSLVTDLANLPRERALVGVIVEAGRQLGLDLVAEGVETRDEQLALEDLGVSHMQGWLFARSMAAEKIPGFVDEFAKRPKLQQVVS